MPYVIAYVATAVAFLALDFVWLGTVANSFYRGQLGPLMRDPINLPAAGLFYLVYVAGLLIFAVAPALSAGSWRTALVYGALLGLVGLRHVRLDESRDSPRLAVGAFGRRPVAGHGESPAWPPPSVS